MPTLFIRFYKNSVEVIAVKFIEFVMFVKNTSLRGVNAVLSVRYTLLLDFGEILYNGSAYNTVDDL
jgi:hypothetical protein